jgi:diacylglycerol kinase (ATP)
MLEYLLFGFFVVCVGLWARQSTATSRVLVHNSFRPNTHRWNELSATALAVCALCRKALDGWCRLEGVQCQICGLTCHPLCARKARGCKVVAEPGYLDSWKHDFKEVFVEKNAKCAQCGHLCGTAFGNGSLKCVWCMVAVHGKCRDVISEECSMGSLKKHVIHPASVRLPLQIHKLEPSLQPLLVVINPRSGGQVGQVALQAFYSVLNPIQVLDVFTDYSRLSLFQGVKDLRILAAGGDGTVAKLLDTLYDDTWNAEPPPIGIFPLGTGNDLSVVFNWGKGLKSRKGKNPSSMLQSALDVIKDLYKSYPSSLDRWTINIEAAGLTKRLTMCNYFGIGVDAKIAHDFHKLREQSPFLFRSRVRGI